MSAPYLVNGKGTFLESRLSAFRNAALRLFVAPQTLHTDFEQDVLERLVKLGANSLGAPLIGVKASLDGQIRVMCEGACPDGYWRKYTLRFTFPFLKDRKLLGDANAVAEAAFILLGSAPKE